MVNSRKRLQERIEFYKHKVKQIAEEGKEEIVEKWGLEIEPFVTIGCLFLCTLTFIAYLWTKDKFVADIVKITFGAFLGSLPGSVRSHNKNKK